MYIYVYIKIEKVWTVFAHVNHDKWYTVVIRTWDNMNCILLNP